MGRDRWYHPDVAPETVLCMIRITIENVFFFLVPTLVYIAWIAFKRDDWPGLWEVLKVAPLLNLFVLGAAMMLTTLVLFSSHANNTPDETYVPPVFQDGKLQPGHPVPASK
jgi:hypothetical protein